MNLVQMQCLRSKKKVSQNSFNLRNNTVVAWEFKILVRGALQFQGLQKNLKAFRSYLLIYNSKIMQKYLGGHLICEEHQEPMNLVCLDQKCPNKGIICPHCEYKTHKHPVRALSSLFAQIQKDIETYQQSLSLMAQVDKIFHQIEEELKKISIPSDRKLAKQMVLTYYNHSVSNLFKRHNLLIDFEHKKRKTVADVNLFINKYDFIDKEQNKDNLSNCEYDVRAKLEELTNILKDLKEYIKNHETIDKILGLFAIEDEKRVRYFFNSQKSHRDIVITDKNRVQLKEGYSYRIALLDPPARKEGGKGKKMSCSFRIVKAVAMVGVGIVYKPKVQSFQYLFSAYAQHGCYFITHTGYTYNEANPSFNSQIKNWNFTSSDVIKITVLPKEKKVTFQKQGKDIFEMPYEDRPESDLNFAVLLCQKDDCAEVVNN